MVSVYALRNSLDIRSSDTAFPFLAALMQLANFSSVIFSSSVIGSPFLVLSLTSKYPQDLRYILLIPALFHSPDSERGEHSNPRVEKFLLEVEKVCQT